MGLAQLHASAHHREFDQDFDFLTKIKMLRRILCIVFRGLNPVLNYHYNLSNY